MTSGQTGEGEHRHIRKLSASMSLFQKNSPATSWLLSQGASNAELWCFSVVSHHELLNKQSSCSDSRHYVALLTSMQKSRATLFPSLPMYVQLSSHAIMSTKYWFLFNKSGESVLCGFNWYSDRQIRGVIIKAGDRTFVRGTCFWFSFNSVLRLRT